MLRKWTIMVYMAGDNGKIFDDNTHLMAPLQLFGWQDIAEMAGVKISPSVATVVQFDSLRRAGQYTARYYIDQSSPTGQLIEKIEPVNTGDPKNLTDFIVWAMQNYPAEQYALILWGHGSGWSEDDIYARYRNLPLRQDEVRAGASGERLLRRALFIPTIAEIISIEDDEIRGICYDDTSMDFLDNADLAKALNDAAQITQHRLSVLGMDACLMSMIEVAYQLHPYTDYMIASQANIPGDGWPYGDILSALSEQPDMSAQEFSRLVVAKYEGRYAAWGRGGTEIMTHAAIDLSVISQTVEKMSKLSKLAAEIYLQDIYTEKAFTQARKAVQRFGEVRNYPIIGGVGADYCDLWHLMQLIELEYAGGQGVGSLAGDVAHQLAIGAMDGPIVANCASPHSKAKGVSVYFPVKGYSPFYDNQAFVASGWGEVIKRANRIE